MSMGAQNSSTAAAAAAAPNKPAVAKEPEDIELKIKQVKRLNPTSASPRVRLMQAKEIDRICRQNSGDFSAGPTAAQDNLHTLRSAKNDSHDIDQTKSQNIHWLYCNGHAWLWDERYEALDPQS